MSTSIATAPIRITRKTMLAIGGLVAVLLITFGVIGATSHPSTPAPRPPAVITHLGMYHDGNSAPVMYYD